MPEDQLAYFGLGSDLCGFFCRTVLGFYGQILMGIQKGSFVVEAAHPLDQFGQVGFIGRIATKSVRLGRCRIKSEQLVFYPIAIGQLNIFPLFEVFHIGYIYPIVGHSGRVDFSLPLFLPEKIAVGIYPMIERKGFHRKLFVIEDEGSNFFLQLVEEQIVIGPRLGQFQLERNDFFDAFGTVNVQVGSSPQQTKGAD